MCQPIPPYPPEANKPIPMCHLLSLTILVAHIGHILLGL